MRDDSLEQQVVRAEQDLLGLKSAQFIGFDSVRSYVTESSNTWDYDRNVGISVDGIYVRFAADNQVAPFAKLQLIVLVDNTTYYTPADSSGSTLGVFMNDTILDTFGIYSPDGRLNLPNEVTFYSAAAVTRNINLKMKFKIYATDTGTLTVKVGNTIILNEVRV